MDPVDFLAMSGGMAGRDLLAASGRHAVGRALEAGALVRVARARFSLPGRMGPDRRALRLGEVMVEQAYACAVLARAAAGDRLCRGVV